MGKLLSNGKNIIYHYLIMTNLQYNSDVSNSVQTETYSIKRKYLKLALVVLGLFFLFATCTLLLVFLQIHQNSYNLQNQRIKSIFPEIERAIENEIIIGNKRGLELVLSSLKKIYNIDSIKISKKFEPCVNKDTLINKKVCNIFSIDKFKNPIYIKIVKKTDLENLHSLIYFFILIYISLFLISLIVLWLSLNKIGKILINPVIELAKNPHEWIANKQYEVSEIELIKVHLKDYYIKLNEAKIQEEKIKIQSAINEISFQIVHDLRSPITALNTLKKYANFDFPTHKDILISCIQRMECLVGELLYDNGKWLSGCTNHKNSNIANVSEIVTSIVNEKIILLNYESKPININIVSKEQVKALVNLNKFSNIISNILNNSIEAIKNTGQIDIHLSYVDNFSLIEIIDNGVGIPQVVLDALGNKKISINKKNGSGIGLYSAYNYLKSIGGELKISNNNGAGAKASIKIPSISEKNTKNTNIQSNFPNNKAIVLLDDSQLVIDTWKLSAFECGIDFSGFKEFKKFMSFTETLGKDTPIYVDSNLENGLKGEEVITQLYQNGFNNLYITTGYEKEKYNKISYIKGIVGKTPPFENRCTEN